MDTRRENLPRRQTFVPADFGISFGDLMARLDALGG